MTATHPEKRLIGYASGHNRRALAEATIGRFKRVIGEGLRSHTGPATGERGGHRRRRAERNAGAGTAVAGLLDQLAATTGDRRYRHAASIVRAPPAGRPASPDDPLVIETQWLFDAGRAGTIEDGFRCRGRHPHIYSKAGTRRRSGRGTSRRRHRLRSERPYEIKQMLANRCILDPEIGLDEFDRLALAQRVGFESVGRKLRKALHCRRAYWVCVVEKERHRHVQQLAQLV